MSKLIIVGRSRYRTMRPYKLIEVGDCYQRPGQSIFWVVINKSDEDKMVELSCSYASPNGHNTMWVKNTNSIFRRKL